MIEVPNTVIGLLGLIVSTLVTVVIYQQKKIDVLYKEKSDLQDKRLIDAGLVRDKYDAGMGKFSQSIELLVAKLSTGKDT